MLHFLLQTILCGAFIALLLSLSYLYLLALASIHVHTVRPNRTPHHRFAITIPAHNEEAVIANTIARLQKLNYPDTLVDIFVVADYCSDQTAQVACSAGAIAFERKEGPRGSKGAALRWLFEKILQSHTTTSYPYDAIIIFDADTLVEESFLKIMDTHLDNGEMVIQGQHRISNPDDGWFPLLTWAMFLIDNRFQNLGRSNLGWSAKHMGDSICFRAEVLRDLGWGEGLTEDYAFRQELLLAGIKIKYEPHAIGYGEAPISWRVARAQRRRWLRGTHDASKQYARRLLKAGLQTRNMALLDGASQAYLPSFSTLTLLAGVFWLVVLLLRMSGQPVSLLPWTILLIAILIYPYWGLMLERAPLKAYIVIASGPFFILWRTWLALTSRWKSGSVKWIRTPRKAENRHAK